VNGKPYIVSVVPEETIADLTTDLMCTASLTEDVLLAIMASMLLREEILSGADSRFVSAALTLLANRGWTHITKEVLDDFCAANGINLGEVA
jgi:hypothetical protein